jgi:HJR/Mrr/RecB family endonuclease
METRADRIYSILENAEDKRLEVSEVRDRLAEIEDAPDLHVSAVSSTARQENKTRRSKGKNARFSVYNDGEKYGYISITEEVELANSIREVVDDYKDQLPAIVERANEEVKENLRDQIEDLEWQEFEDNFLTSVLEALGFTNVEITQKTRDGGVDAVATYQRGIVRSKAIISAKHWSSSSVSHDEIQRVRGIEHEADTAIIVTSSRFTDPAKEKAKPSPGWRSVVLVDGDLIVNTCLENSIGVEEVNLPSLYRSTDLRVDIEGEDT